MKGRKVEEGIQGNVLAILLVANSIVQDGHGTLPLLAVSKSAFLRLKLINLVVGIAAGGLMLLWTR